AWLRTIFNVAYGSPARKNDYFCSANCRGADELTLSSSRHRSRSHETTVKWAFLIMAAALVWPLSSRLRRNPGDRVRIFALMAFLPFVLSTMHLYWAVVSWQWVGYVKGAEVSLLDFIALSIYLTLPRPEGRLPFRWSMAPYFAVTALSAIQAL